MATLGVCLALASASFALITGMSNTLFGRAQSVASGEVDRIAEALARGEPIPERLDIPPGYVTTIQIRDASGRLIETLPPTTATVARRPVPSARPPAAAGTAPGESLPRDMRAASRTVMTPQGQRTVVAVSRLGQISQSIDLVERSLLVAAPLLALVVGLLTWFAVDRSLRPIEALRARTEAISHSTLGERLPEPDTGDEVQRLARTLNEMLDRLDVGARVQRDFLSDASHELRTPLAAMRAELEISIAHGQTADWPAVAARLHHDTRRMERLTGDLLMLARAEDTTASRSPQPVRLDEIVAAEVPETSHAALFVSLEPVEIIGVPAELSRLARNLLDNADRHAVHAIAVRLMTERNMAVVTVDDDGPGVPPGQRERVFDRFFRLDAGRDRASGGVGLGLAMTRSIARGHGGDVHVTTAPLGGARFEVRLPLSPPDPV
ncbi:cell wall metabolism sensor histidine kinase WalK [Frankia sp. AiPa1]|uniref:sensor histidine kinase n=1 Tax=Frankia sp. AiPa1 TaxID=573492 RepID=UPI00202B885D|nr:HAMP domain-containing sensor histidine kinase [Frankia sp. AiPa1]MCL9760228.1 HAMP domain-containing histidine kinase [Frankia sp. AiPa1]